MDSRWSVGNSVMVAEDLGKFLGFPSEGTSTAKDDQQAGVDARSFAEVIRGLPDLKLLPEPVVSGGVTHVILPQDIVDKQLEKYRLALVSCVFSKEEDIRRTSGDNVIADLNVTSGKVLGRWKDAVDDDVSLNNEDVALFEDGEVKGVVEGIVNHPVVTENNVVGDAVDTVINFQENMVMIASGEQIMIHRQVEELGGGRIRGGPGCC
ncbi:hypothetical protein NE237_027939 [Protea cynaroides]|uniref:Uncharacterized protein n=1 Tax=Protea cynaroides TaxID=273540 RepID=A0A9Q0JTM6_9MAGN|nr:hypothetical protein NE237_027939 [Protea cynaroides]